MADGRRNNGGNSTKATRPDDKRLNPAKKLLSQYITEDLDFNKLKTLLDTLYQKGIKGDSRSSALFLSYVLGKPKETVDITTNDESINSFDLSKASDKQLDALLSIYGRKSINS